MCVHCIRSNWISNVTVEFFTITFAFVYVIRTSRENCPFDKFDWHFWRSNAWGLFFADQWSHLLTYYTNSSKIRFIQFVRYVQFGPLDAYLQWKTSHEKRQILSESPKNSNKIMEMLNIIYGDNTLRNTTMFKWIIRFNKDCKGCLENVRFHLMWQ